MFACLLINGTISADNVVLGTLPSSVNCDKLPNAKWFQGVIWLPEFLNSPSRCEEGVCFDEMVANFVPGVPKEECSYQVCDICRTGAESFCFDQQACQATQGCKSYKGCLVIDDIEKYYASTIPYIWTTRGKIIPTTPVLCVDTTAYAVSALVVN
eukprot:TRINITY_DN3522_c0_g3_i15.p2 TRINITY_DN3522_c0_g3~~TRINITY_DN3522_c0_g3_i15.p2  ORF type:complete len:155 (+),score=22.72 TRINITY_DN3522_c0_g3_i15:1-465(+)